MENPMTGNVQLRDVHNEDLSIFFEQQLDMEASYMAAFVSENPSDRDVFNARWTKILGNNSFQKKTILFNGQVAGNIMSPLYARAVKDNMASIRVLQKCGFKITGTNKGFANARGEEVEEVILRLD
ncbi:GNAT family N-acetyltransferase [Brevibacillus sp. SYSU BS000544]|uniref:GNAT family N-acetyltransferase n=1 Tax=Brevibacillus sp. SYSU BS000544 TaxID=3416443 RepID=UPI003CE58D12